MSIGLALFVMLPFGPTQPPWLSSGNSSVFVCSISVLFISILLCVLRFFALVFCELDESYKLVSSLLTYSSVTTAVSCFGLSFFFFFSVESHETPSFSKLSFFELN